MKQHVPLFEEFEASVMQSYFNEPTEYTDFEIMNILTESYISSIVNVEVYDEIMLAWTQVNESWIGDKAREFKDKAKGVVDKLGDAAKQSWEWVQKNAKAAMEMIKEVANKVTTFTGDILQKGWSKFVGEFMKEPHLKEAVEKEDKNNIVKELGELAKLLKFILVDMPKKLIIAIKDALVGLFTKKEMTLESLNESKTYLKIFRNLMRLVEKLPPFSWLHHIASLAEKGIDKAIEGMNGLSKALGGPVVTIPIIIGLLAILIEYQFKGAAKGAIAWVSGLMTANPALGTVIAALAWIATVIAGIHAIDKLSGGKVLGH